MGDRFGLTNMFTRDIPHASRNQPLAKREIAEPWEQQRARQILIATGRLIDFHVSDIPDDELRQIVEIAARSRRMRKPDFSITRERYTFEPRTGTSLVWDEVMK